MYHTHDIMSVYHGCKFIPYHYILDGSNTPWYFVQETHHKLAEYQVQEIEKTSPKCCRNIVSSLPLFNGFEYVGVGGKLIQVFLEYRSHIIVQFFSKKGHMVLCYCSIWLLSNRVINS